MPYYIIIKLAFSYSCTLHYTIVITFTNWSAALPLTYIFATVVAASVSVSQASSLIPFIESTPAAATIPESPTTIYPVFSQAHCIIISLQVVTADTPIKVVTVWALVEAVSWA